MSEKNADTPQQTSEDDFYPEGFVIDDSNIDDDFKVWLDPLPSNVLRDLERDIVKNGCREPLTMWVEEGLLLDGHHRHKICKDNNKPYRVRKQSLKSREEAEIWIVKNQKNRRNTNKFQLAISALKCRKSIEKIAKAAQSAGGGSVKQKSAEPVNTEETMAKMAGISRPTLQQIEYILQHADEQTLDKLRSGDASLSINGVYVSLKEGNEKPTDDKKKKTKSVKKASSQEVEKKVNNTISNLDKFELKLSKKDDRMYFYNKIIKWANARKQGKKPKASKPKK